MEDLEIAKEIISAIIDKEIISLTLKPQEKSLEYSVEIDRHKKIIKKILFTTIWAYIGEIINSKYDFIECLTHNSFIIQIPKLHPTMKTKIEKILSIFDQKEKTSRNFFINYEYEPKDEIMKRIIKILLKAASNPKVKEELELEEEKDRLIKELMEKLGVRCENITQIKS